MTELKQLRNQIDNVDRQLTDLLNQRFQLTKLVAEVKAETGGPVLDSNREAMIITKVSNLVADPQTAEMVANIFQVIMETSKQQQRKLLHQVEEER